MEDNVLTEGANKVITSVDSIAKTIQDLFTSLREPAKQIPAITLLCSLVQRPGLSSLATTARIITRLGGLGLPTGKMPDGSENMMNLVIGVIVVGIKYMMANPEGKAKLKGQLIGLAVATIVIYGAQFIWSTVISVFPD